MMHRTAAVLILMALELAGPAEARAASLEQAIQGRFVARGYARLKPGWPAERVFCRLVGQMPGAKVQILRIRCATDAISVAVRLELAVLEPARRYRLETFTPWAWLFGYNASYSYAGVATVGGVDFETDFQLGEQRYRSNVRVRFGATGVERIVETVRAAKDGRRSVLISLTVERE